jgi:hypothetical protein
MIRLLPPGETIMKGDAPHPAASPRPHVIPGEILWTMTKGDGLARARQWVTPRGFELEIQIWSHYDTTSEEDLSWSQVFPAASALADVARAKKVQLQAIGWIEELDGSAVAAARSEDA